MAIHPVSEKKSHPEQHLKSSRSSSHHFGNALLSVYFALAEASSLQNGVALLDSKRLERNAQEMEKENAETANLGWSQIPGPSRKEVASHHTSYFLNAFNMLETHIYTTYKMVTTNLGQIQAANFGNQVANGNLEILQNRIAVTQQQARIDENRLGTHTNDAAQVIQEAGFLLDSILSLSRRALQRRDNS